MDLSNYDLSARFFDWIERTLRLNDPSNGVIQPGDNQGTLHSPGGETSTQKYSC